MDLLRLTGLRMMLCIPRNVAGAYRGYGATQGIFAVESAVSEMAARLGIDPIRIPGAEHGP